MDRLHRQGDVFIQEVSEVPSSALQRSLGHGTLAHGEVTGHSHRVETLDSAKLFVGDDGSIFLRVDGPEARIVHDEHGPILLPTGTYRVWRQREYDPDRDRIVAD